MLNKNYAPKLYKSTANMTTKEWEQERTHSIGGSDMAVLLGLNHFDRTKRDLFYVKTGVAPVNKSQDKYLPLIFNSGHFLEETVAELFSYRTGLEAYEIKAMFEHPLHPHIRGNIDRFYRRKGDTAPVGFLECKTTSEYNRGWSDGKIPTDYIVQISTYMSILNMNTCKISCLFIPETVRVIAGVLFQLKSVFGKLSPDTLADVKAQLEAISDEETKIYVPTVLSAIGGSFLIPKELLKETSEAIGDKLVIRDFERDEQLEEQILNAADDFWFNYVQKGVVPPLDGEDGEAAIHCLDKYIVKKSSAPAKVLPEELVDSIAEIDRLKQYKSTLNASVKEVDKQIEKLTVPIIEALDGISAGSIVSTNGSYDVTYKKGNETVSVPKKNLEKLKNAYPEAYDACVEKRSSKEKLTIKARKD